MKKSEISLKVFDTVGALPVSELSGGALTVPVADLAGLALVPWFCDASVQWAFRITQPGRPLKKSLLKKVNDSFITEQAGAVLIGVPGDGIEPSTFTLFPLAEAIAKVLHPGMTLELAAANLGIVKRDWEVKAETTVRHGNQRYVGMVDGEGRWAIAQASVALTREELASALACGRRVATNGPWPVTDKAHAHALIMGWISSPQAGINPMAVKRFVTLKDDGLVCEDAGMQRKLCGLGLAYFRERFANGPFQWDDAGPQRHTKDQLEDVARSVTA